MTDNGEITYTGNIFVKVFKWGSPNPKKAILHALNTTEELLENCQGWVVDELAELWPKFRVFQKAKGRDLVQLLHQLRTKFGWSGRPKTLPRMTPSDSRSVYPNFLISNGMASARIP